MENEVWWEVNIPISSNSIHISWCKQNPKRKTSWMKGQSSMNKNLY
jgi:hypothetical protein